MVRTCPVHASSAELAYILGGWEGSVKVKLACWADAIFLRRSTTPEAAREIYDRGGGFQGPRKLIKPRLISFLVHGNSNKPANNYQQRRPRTETPFCAVIRPISSAETPKLACIGGELA